jgi:diamine N-acetyltransferase
MTQPLKFRSASLEDLPVLLPFAKDMFIRAFEMQNSADNLEKYVSKAFNIEQFKHELGQPNSAFYLLYLDNALVGYSKLNFRLRPDEHDVPTLEEEIQDEAVLCELQRIYIHPAMHGNGIATEAMTHAEAAAKAAGCNRLWLGVWEENHRALRFYEKCGFTRLGAHNFVFGDALQTDFLLWKAL